MPEDDPTPPEAPHDPASREIQRIGSSPQDLLAKYLEMKDNLAKTVSEAGGPEAFIREVAPRALSLFAGPWSAKLVATENLVGWSQANERLAQCATCPGHGRTPCDGSLGLKEGLKIRIDVESIHFDDCDRFSDWKRERRILAAGIPSALSAVTLDRLFERVADGRYPIRDQLRAWMGKVLKESAAPSFLLTGGQSRKRTELAAAIARNLCRNPFLHVHYTFGPLLAALLREHYNDETDEDPLAKCAAADVLIFDFLDPVPISREAWKPWFIERIDRMLYGRLSAEKPTILSSRASLVEISEHFQYMSVLPLLELDISDPEFGPFRS
jgi:hypothetical protein